MHLLSIHLVAPGLSCGIFVLTHGIFSCSMWCLVPWPEMESRPPALGSWSLSHWTTREVPDKETLEWWKRTHWGEKKRSPGFLTHPQTHTFFLLYLFLIALALWMFQFIIFILSVMWHLEKETPQALTIQCLCRSLGGFMSLIKAVFLGKHWLNREADVASPIGECAFPFNYSYKGSSEASIFHGFRQLLRL